MWEVSSAGPLSGAAVSTLLLGAGLLQSQQGGDASSVADMLVSVSVTRLKRCHLRLLLHIIAGRS